MNERRPAAQYFASAFDGGMDFDAFGGADAGADGRKKLAPANDKPSMAYRRLKKTFGSKNQKPSSLYDPSQSQTLPPGSISVGSRSQILGNGASNKNVIGKSVRTQRNSTFAKKPLNLVRQVTDNTAPSSTPGTSLGSGSGSGSGYSSEKAVGKFSESRQTMGSGNSSYFGAGAGSAGANSNANTNGSNKSRPSPLNHFQFDTNFIDHQQQQNSLRQQHPLLISPIETPEQGHDDVNAFFPPSDQQDAFGFQQSSNQNLFQNEVKDLHQNENQSRQEMITKKEKESIDFLQCTSIEFTKTEELDLFPVNTAFASKKSSNGETSGGKDNAPPIQSTRDHAGPSKSKPQGDVNIKSNSKSNAKTKNNGNGKVQHTRTAIKSTSTAAAKKDFDIYQFDGLMMDDSTVGTALSQRHLLKNDPFTPQKNPISSTGSIKGTKSGVAARTYSGNTRSGTSNEKKGIKSPLRIFKKASTPRKLKQKARMSRDSGSFSDTDSAHNGLERWQQSRPQHQYDRALSSKSKQWTKRSLRLEQKMNETHNSREKLLQHHGYSSKGKSYNSKEKRSSLSEQRLNQHEEHRQREQEKHFFNHRQPNFGDTSAITNASSKLSILEDKSPLPSSQAKSRTLKQYKLSHESMILNEAKIDDGKEAVSKPKGRAKNLYKLSHESMLLNEVKANSLIFDKMQQRSTVVAGKASFASSVSAASSSATSNFTFGSVPKSPHQENKDKISIKPHKDQPIASPAESKASNRGQQYQLSDSHDIMSPLLTNKNIKDQESQNIIPIKRLPSLSEHESERSGKQIINQSGDLPPRPNHTSRWKEEPDRSDDLPPLPNVLSESNKNHINSVDNLPVGPNDRSHDLMSPLVQKRNVDIKAIDAVKSKHISDHTKHSTEANPESATPEHAEKGRKAKQLDTLTPLSHASYTPKKKSRGISSTFLDKSWQPSPIKPGGSFAIFDDTQIDDSGSNDNEDAPVYQDTIPIVYAQSRQESEQFVRVVAAIVLQTFFRRHLAYNFTCKRYAAVLKIQRFLRDAITESKIRRRIDVEKQKAAKEQERLAEEERRMALEQQRLAYEQELIEAQEREIFFQEQERLAQERQRIALSKTTYQFYNLAALQIQAAWRGWWVRDCINVEAYCATTIQKAFRSYWGRLNYRFDLYRIIISQSVVRKYLARSRLRREQKAATMIQSQWRVYVAKNRVINKRADIQIVESVSRRHLAPEKVNAIKPEIKPKRQLGIKQNYAPASRRTLMNNALVSCSEKTLKSGSTNRSTNRSKIGTTETLTVTRENLQKNNLTQMNSDELIRKWQSRRARHSELESMAEF